MKNINFYQKFSKKSLYFIAGVFALSVIILSQVILPPSAGAYYYDYFSDPYYSGYYGGYYGGYDDYGYGGYGGYDYGYGGYDDYGYDYDYSYPSYYPYSGGSYYTPSYAPTYQYSTYYQPTTYQPISYQPYQPTYSQPTTYQPYQAAQNPRFNIFTPYVHTQTAGRDYYLFDVKNETKNTDWNFPVSADPGDVLVFSVYYHNGVVGTTATNTTMRVTLPAGTAASHNLTAYLWADNAENATLSSPMSQSVGVNLSSAASLAFAQSSIKWYPNQTDWRYDPPTALPYGQSGQELFGSGLRIGNATGCWEYSGYIIFKMQVSQPIPANLQIVKTARNLSDSQYSFGDAVLASPGQRIEFLLEVQASNAEAKNVSVIDLLPSEMTFIPGTVKINGQSTGANINVEPGVSLGNLLAGQVVRINFEASIKDASAFSKGDTILTNTATVRADNASPASDIATITVKVLCDPTIDTPAMKSINYFYYPKY